MNSTENSGLPGEAGQSARIVDMELIRLGGLTEEAFRAEMARHLPTTMALLCHRLGVQDGEGAVSRLWTTCKAQCAQWMAQHRHTLTASEAA